MSFATEMLEAYIAAEKAVLKGQSYTINGRSLTRANLNEIRNGYNFWEAKVMSERARQDGASSTYSLVDFSRE